VLEATSVEVRSEVDIVAARRMGRALAQELGFSAIELTMIVTAISELARNIVRYAGRGAIQLKVERNHVMTGMVVVATDTGPGILDLTKAMQDGYSTSGSLGLGLPGVRRLMDDFRIECPSDGGTVVTAKKWKR
jgi:serine/threonine-protein kinase RsbT